MRSVVFWGWFSWVVKKGPRAPKTNTTTINHNHSNHNHNPITIKPQAPSINTTTTTPIINPYKQTFIKKGMPVIYPRNDLTYAENLLYMMHAVPCEPYRVDALKAKALETILVLHMDHEQNASTVRRRVCGIGIGFDGYVCVGWVGIDGCVGWIGVGWIGMGGLMDGGGVAVLLSDGTQERRR